MDTISGVRVHPNLQCYTIDPSPPTRISPVSSTASSPASPSVSLTFSETSSYSSHKYKMLSPSSKPVDLSSCCLGTPSPIGSSSMGGVSLYLSLQESKIFLSSPPSSVSGYGEIDEASLRLIQSENDMREGPERFARVNARESRITSSLDPDTTSELQPSILRGSLLLKLAKSTKIKCILVKFYGKCNTDILTANDTTYCSPDRTGQKFHNSVIINSHTWEFMPSPPEAKVKSSIVTMDATSVTSTDLYGADVAYFQSDLDGAPSNSTRRRFSTGEICFKSPVPLVSEIASNSNPSSLNNTPLFKPVYFDESKSHVTARHGPVSPAFATSSETTYPPGQYVFNFTLAIDPSTAETISCANGSIRYFVSAKVERASRFAGNVEGGREVELVRCPPVDCEVSCHNPLTFSGKWGDHLQYELNSPHLYTPLGSSMPIAIKLKPLDKIRVHRVRVYILESVTYISSRDSRLRSREPTRKVLIFHKIADELKKKKGQEKDKPGPADMLQYDSTGALMDTTELDVSTPFIASAFPGAGSTLSLCGSMLSDRSFFNADAKYNPLIHVDHRLSFSIRVSRIDPATGQWRYFEISNETPVYFLSEQCKGESTTLPPYYYADPVTCEEPTVFGSPADVREVYVDSTDGASFIPLLGNRFSRGMPTFDDVRDVLDKTVALPSFTDSLRHRRFIEPDPSSRRPSLISNSSSSSEESILEPPKYEEYDYDPAIVRDSF